MKNAAYVVTGYFFGIVTVIIVLFVYYLKWRKKHPQSKPKIEFSKLILAGIMMTYFVGTIVGIICVFKDPSGLGYFLSYVGAPTAVSIGFYSWKAKSENLVKLRSEFPEESVGIENVN